MWKFLYIAVCLFFVALLGGAGRIIEVQLD